MKMASGLVPLPEVQRISSRVIRILGGNPGKFTLQGTNTYIVGTGPYRLLIDTGEGRPSWIKALKELLRVEKATISRALISHCHIDHVGGIRQLLEEYPDVKIYKHLPDEGQLDIDDGEHFSVIGATLRAVHSPGHTKDHMVFILEEEDAMFTGDNVLGQGTAVFEDLSVYLDSLQKMRTLFSGQAYPGHGPVIDNGKGKVTEYIRHRQEREEQVLQVLRSPYKRSGFPNQEVAIWDWPSMDIVKVIYKDVPKNLHLAAHSGIVQVLRKLRLEGKVDEADPSGTWRLKDQATL